MVYKKNQVFKVKNINSMLSDTNKYYRKFDGDIYLKGNNKTVSFNTFMQSKTEVTVKQTVNQDTFIGDDGWYWYEWMLDIPKTNMLMETE